ncbi:cytidylate kinase [Candidatus Bathyarchaeota archaeon]|nr:MAG: cytidylate kinase [Candidatus Bathyarchaeota archaeon]TMI31553.1 MAG: cytidylate kinase [Candidatus Bathyarchaeota archaeon]
MIITVSGPHGTGKSTYAAKLASALGLRHVSAGQLFRKLAKEKGYSLEQFGQLAAEDPAIDRVVDEETMKEAEKGDLVIDGQLTGWVLREVADLRIYLTAPENIRFERIAERDRMGIEEARKLTLQREKVQNERYKKHYGLRLEDRTIYHIILDTSFLPQADTEKVLLTLAISVRDNKARRTKKA